MTGRLGGLGVGVTRPGQGAGPLGALLRRDGAEVFHWPCIRFEPPDDPECLLSAARGHRRPHPGGEDWLILTSPQAAEAWLRAIDTVGGSKRRWKTAALGAATAAVLEEGGWPVDLTPEDPSAEGLVRSFAAAGDAAGSRFLIPRSNLADEELPDGLRSLDAEVQTIVAYRTVPAPPSPRFATEILGLIDSNRLHVITFTSPSTVAGFLAAFETALKDEVGESVFGLAAVAIGPTTAAALSAAGWDSAVAEQPTPAALLEAVVEATESQPDRRRRGS